MTEPVCFHCGEPVPGDVVLTVLAGGARRPVCCNGCQAVVELIHATGLSRYYEFRSALGRRVDAATRAARDAWSDLDERESLWGGAAPDGSRELLLQTEGIRCAACAWLIRSRLESLPGIRSVQVDVASGYTHIRWHPLATRLSRIAGALFDLGYVPHLPLAQAEEAGRRAERRDSLKRLGVAGLGMMQVMMYAVGLYAGDEPGAMSPAARGFLTWVSLIITLPVLLYSGRVFFTGAWRGLRAGRPGMDLPVALAIGLAFTASCVNFFRGAGEVWFDSVVMFIFFLTLGRHVELVLRHRNLQAGSALARLLPEWAKQLTAAGTRTVPAIDLRPADRVRVAAGAAFPCDGRILAGGTEVDESLLTGESRPLPRRAGDNVIAGSINLSQPVDVEVTAAAADSAVSTIGRLLLQGLSRRDGQAGLPGWLVPAFIVAVLLLAGGAGAYWAVVYPPLALPAALAVLVASCPCALSLALPAVNAAASRSLLLSGILLTRGEALHRMRQVDTVVFDKTGTLTQGRPERGECRLNPARSSGAGHAPREAEPLAIAAALESHSAHPVARAFADIPATASATGVVTAPGQGLEGTVGGRRWRIGSANYVAPADPPPEPVAAAPTIWLGDDRGWIAGWPLSDRLRPGSEITVRMLRDRGLDIRICSGDAASAVRPVAAALSVDNWQARCSPAEKVRMIQELHKQNKVILMIGDGVNDAPVLAHADVSMAVQGAAELANSTADLILTADSLDRVGRAFELAAKAGRLVRQNFTWALLYNAGVLPLAVSGALKPWMAALGMSASSLLVVLNATRMSSGRRRGELRPHRAG